MRDFEASAEFLFIQPNGSDSVSLSTESPQPKTMTKKKYILCLKARQELEEVDGDNFFPTGIENEVVFLEITNKTLSMLYSQCQVSDITFSQEQGAKVVAHNQGRLECEPQFGRSVNLNFILLQSVVLAVKLVNCNLEINYICRAIISSF